MDHGKHTGHHAQATSHGVGHHDPKPSGTSASEQGYTLELESRILPVPRGEIRFAIRGSDGTPLRTFDRIHERELHLIVVSKDLLDYAHLHPRRDEAGNWSVSLPRLEPGPQRLYADFKVQDGPSLSLRVEAVVPGERRTRPAPMPSKSASVDGFDAVLDGRFETGAPVRVTIDISRRGVPAELEPYLGARAHLVAIRAADGAFLHVHPLHDDSAAGRVAFRAVLPSAGRYRLFVDFRVEGVVRTASFTVDALDRERER